MITAEQMHPEHQITVTRAPFGRAWFDCSCGLERVFVSKHAANQVALAHLSQTTVGQTVDGSTTPQPHHPGSEPMTQQPYPQQPYPQQYAPQPVQQPYAPAPQQYAAQPYVPQPQAYAPPVQQPYAQPPVPQGPPLADGSLDAFYNQPNTGGGPGVSWKGKPDGFTVQGFVPRDVTNADVTQEVGAPNTQQAGQPQFYRDGRPKFVMAVPLQLQPSPEYPDGEARLFVRGQLRDELARAMAEAGADGAPKAGAVLTVTLVERKQGRGTIPQNVFRCVYTPPGQQAPQVQQPQPAPQQYAQQPAPQQFAQAPQQQAYAPQPVQPVVYAAAPGAPSPAPVAQQPQQVAQAPAPQPQQTAPQPPAGLSPEQQAILAQVAGQQGQQD